MKGSMILSDNMQSSKISEGDNLPTQVCDDCVNQVNRFHSFKLQCENSHSMLSKYLETQPQVKNEQVLVNCSPSDAVQVATLDLCKEEVKATRNKGHIWQFSTGCILSEGDMATARFKDPSPYKTERPSAPETDFLYSRFEKDVTLDVEKTTSGEAIGIALFGAGRAGTIHLRSLVRNPRVRLLYIVEDLDAKWEDIRRYWKLEDVQFLKSKDQKKVFQDGSVDAVLVASPTFTHEGIVTGALSHGKAVFCEKPITENNITTERCFQTAKQQNLPLFCAFNKRFDPSYRHIKERVRAGEVGHVQLIKICSKSSPLASLDYLKSSGGVFHDSVVHDIDIMCWILGEFPIKVAASAQVHIPEIAAIGDHDTVAIVFTFASGTLGILDWCRYSCFGYDQRLEVSGPRGIICCNNERPLAGVTSQTKGLEGPSSVPNYYTFSSRYQMAYANEVEHFIDVLQGKAKMATTGPEAMAVIRIATACEESARTGKFVELKWGPEFDLQA